MPFPDHAFTINGGCNCKSIRYKIEVPALPERAPYPLQQTIKFPVAAVCHCNNCRSANGALLNYCVLNIRDWVSISFEKGEWVGAKEVFDEQEGARERGTMRVYEPKKERARAFCGRCGTQVFYFAWGLPEGWTPMLDIWMGTVDRVDLERDWLKIERHLWVEVGIPWVNELACEGSGGVPRHPSYRVDELVVDTKH